MYRLQHMCGLHLHKLASEQVPSDAALVELVHLANYRPAPDHQARRDDRNISGTPEAGGTLSSGRPFSPTR
jgi:hypothetical protein